MLEIGKTYGYLKVLEQDKTPAKKIADHCVHWICECQLCGTIKSISGKNIRNGDTKSCGCLESNGEKLIAKILTEYNIKFEKEYSFSNLKSNYNLPLRFDFAIFYKNKLIGLIEFQGIQHFQESRLARDNLTDRQYRDKLKYDYCVQNKINILYFNNKSSENFNVPEQELKDKIINFYTISQEKNNGKIFSYDY